MRLTVDMGRLGAAPGKAIWLAIRSACIANNPGG